MNKKIINVETTLRARGKICATLCMMQCTFLSSVLNSALVYELFDMDNTCLLY